VARRLFGTDGVRGVAGEFLTAELTLALGRAATARAKAGGPERPRVLVLRDTRASGEMLEAAVAAGIAAAGGVALLGGVLPTPAAPLLIRRYGFDLGVVLSASHNPWRDNGVKFFGADGDKLSDAVEEEIEQLLEAPEGVAPTEPGGVTTLLGAHVDAIADAPDGRNINDGCGSTHVEQLADAVRAGGHDAGFAFDGDGDRVLAVDRTGAVVDGDELIALAALHLRGQGKLPGEGVAVTVMTNYGFHTAMAAAGIEVATTAVGDRYVLEALRERGWALGGEQSGHILELGFAPSGDGIASALLTLEALDGRDLAERHAMEKLPQKLVNVRLPDRAAVERAAAGDDMVAAVEREQDALAGRGRVLVRASGTEPLLRVMVEAPSAEEADAVCGRLVERAQSAAAEPAR
jgi:phosphoglucosamine mutase